VSQVNRSIVAQPIPLKEQPQRYVAAVGIATAIAAGVMAAVFAVSSITSAPVATAPILRTEDLERIVDGWMPAVVAAQAAHLTRVQDGYLPGLVASRSGGDPVDGYIPGLLAGHQTEDLSSLLH
jgi:hypothetical protein